ncbi:MAG: hypothetical protein CVT68_08300 [Actinobacteria bacterium HGW-Actinobacteria-8]|nr:MAG: hypothetical protein CVT68_08300 [Actinobacteria bacterium HGW-Actinobacteria-8]
MHRWRLALLAAVATLVLGGCLRFTADLTLEPDDTVSGQYVVAVEKGTGDTYGMSDQELSQELWADYGKAKTLPDVTYGDYSEDGYVGVTVSFADAPLDTFAPTNTDWGIQRIGDEFVVSGPSNAVPQDVQSEAPQDDLASGLADAQFAVSVTFPGNVTEHNGSVTNRTVTWLLQDAPTELSARGSAIAAPDRATPLAWFAAAVLLVGGLAYGFAGQIARRKR